LAVAKAGRALIIVRHILPRNTKWPLIWAFGGKEAQNVFHSGAGGMENSSHRG